MDRGIPSEAILAEMRNPARPMSYLVGTGKGKIKQYQKKWLDLPWHKVRDSVEVKLFEQDGELYVRAKSEAGNAKRSPYGGNGWPGYCVSCVRCATAYLRGISC